MGLADYESCNRDLSESDQRIHKSWRPILIAIDCHCLPLPWHKASGHLVFGRPSLPDLACQKLVGWLPQAEPMRLDQNDGVMESRLGNDDTRKTQLLTNNLCGKQQPLCR